MNNDELKVHFDTIIKKLCQSENYDAVARAELMKEYYTNQDFKSALEQYVFSLTDS